MVCSSVILVSVVFYRFFKVHIDLSIHGAAIIGWIIDSIIDSIEILYWITVELLTVVIFENPGAINRIEFVEFRISHSKWNSQQRSVFDSPCQKIHNKHQQWSLILKAKPLKTTFPLLALRHWTMAEFINAGGPSVDPGNLEADASHGRGGMLISAETNSVNGKRLRLPLGRIEKYFQGIYDWSGLTALLNPEYDPDWGSLDAQLGYQWHRCAWF